MTPEAYGYKKKGTLTLPFKLISKSNWKPKGRFYLPQKYADFENRIAALALGRFGRREYTQGWIVLLPNFKTKTHPDLSNCTKSVCDGLVKGGLFKDDKLLAVTVCPPKYGDELSTLEVWA